ncbi:hypothetical protein [Nonomuraea sp. 10N515B]|uniref:hypothetical protein n=1 Tax=Nonomuraea sp. 10N515B TaxID=3457422 RepID=UPI003FCEBB80
MEPAGQDAARLLSLLGLLDLPRHTPTTAALADWTEHRADRLLSVIGTERMDVAR